MPTARPGAAFKYTAPRADNIHNTNHSLRSKEHATSMRRFVHDILRPQLFGALALCWLSVVGSTTAMGGWPETTAYGPQSMTATALASAKLESLKTLGWQHLAHSPSDEAYQSMADFPTFRRHTVIAPDTTGLGLRQATVTVWWGQDAHAVRLSMMLAE